VKPLAGKTVLVTRPAEDSKPLADAIRRRGGRPLLAPTIEIVPARSAALTSALRDLAGGRFAWITLTSRSTVDVLASRLSSPTDVRARVAAIGDGTASSFRAWARRPPDLQPSTFTTAALARAFPRGRGRVLCARADVAPEGLEDALRSKGWTPVRVDAYRTRFVRSLPADAGRALEEGVVDAVTFTSASTVRGFVRAARRVGRRPVVVCIGPVTARTARDRGLTVAAEADPHTLDGLVTALVEALRRGGGTKPGLA
jgi:uroporphyrinogen-III synthase